MAATECSRTSATSRFPLPEPAKRGGDPVSERPDRTVTPSLSTTCWSLGKEVVSGDRDPTQQSQIRAAKNEVLFREVNERIQALRPPSTFVEFVCECAKAECDAPISTTHQEYESLRSVPYRFAVKPGHALPLVELVVVEHAGRYDTIERSE